jgi:ribosomal protein S18 acetylase RimI-like enzyme
MYPIIVSKTRRAALDQKAKTVKVQFVRPEFMDGVVNIELAAHRLGPEVQRRALNKFDLMEEIARPETRVFVATADDAVVGWLLFERDGDTARIGRLSANPRRHGYGSALLAAAVKLAHKGSCEKMVADVYEEDLAAQNFFKAKGFKATPVKKAAWGGPGLRFSKAVG